MYTDASPADLDKTFSKDFKLNPKRLIFEIINKYKLLRDNDSHEVIYILELVCFDVDNHQYLSWCVIINPYVSWLSIVYDSFTILNW